jgi:MFS family permease
MVVLGSITLLSAVFFAPVTDFFTRYLDRDRGFSSTEIVIFLVVTGAPAVATVFLGGHLGDRVGRKRIGIPLLAFCGLCFIGFYLSDGPALWVLAALGQGAAAAGFAAMAPYGPEMFPTRVRGAANAVLAVVTVAGSAIGLVTAGLLSDPLGLGEAIAILAVAPAASLLITVFGLPETAGLELEQTSGEASPARRA